MFLRNTGIKLTPNNFIRIFTIFGLSVILWNFSGCDSKTTNSDKPPVEDSIPIDIGFSADNFLPADSCRSCHPVHVAEWEGSMHAFAFKDPVFHALNTLGQSRYVGALDQGCNKCHGMIGSRAGLTPWGGYDFDALPQVVKDGIGCEVCHSISGLTAIENGEVTLTDDSTKYGGIRNPVPNPAHKSEFRSLYQSSAYCGSCHEITLANGVGLETTFSEWERAGFAMTGKTCQDCHMKAYQGEAVPGGPQRTLHEHTMVGGDLALIPFPDTVRQRQLVTELLQNALTVNYNWGQTASAGLPYSFSIDLINDKTGHSVPSGATFMRQVWLSVIAQDALGNVLYSSGQLDVNGDLMDSNSAFPERDADLFNLQATMLRADGHPTNLSWDAADIINPSIKAGETRSVNYNFNLPPSAVTPMIIDVKLYYRSFPPYILRSLSLDSLLPLPIIEMSSDSKTIQILK